MQYTPSLPLARKDEKKLQRHCALHIPEGAGGAFGEKKRKNEGVRAAVAADCNAAAARRSSVTTHSARAVPAPPPASAAEALCGHR